MAGAWSVRLAVRLRGDAKILWGRSDTPIYGGPQVTNSCLYWHGSRPTTTRHRTELPLMTTMASSAASTVNVVGPKTRESGRVLTPDALTFLGRLHAEFAD